jgi:hypothetical protein
LKEAIELEPDVSADELLRIVRQEGIWNGERLGCSKETRPYGFNLCLEVQAGTTRIRFVDITAPKDVWPEEIE